MRNVAADMLHAHMQRTFDVNPRGELYRTLPQAKLLSMLRQNIDELELAIKYDNDVEDKLADAGNYIAFIYRNYVDNQVVEPQVTNPDTDSNLLAHER